MDTVKHSINGNIVWETADDGDIKWVVNRSDSSPRYGNVFTFDTEQGAVAFALKWGGDGLEGLAKSWAAHMDPDTLAKVYYEGTKTDSK